MKKHTVCLIEGDGIGPEVCKSTVNVLCASGVNIEWVHCLAGQRAVDAGLDVIPKQTLDAIEKYRIALKGPVTTPIGKGFTSVNVGLRKHFNLFAALRPVRSIVGIKTRYNDVELVVVRENTEGLYSGLEHEVVPGVVESLKIATKAACERISKYAFLYAKSKGRKKVTVFHKANIMKLSDGLFLDCAQRMHKEYGQGIQYEDMIIDNACMQLVKDPSKFDVLLMENLYGDVISDLCAGLVGGLGVVPGANIGDDCAIFESVHGSAPDIAGQGLANPLACIMSAVMMLNYLKEDEAANRIKAAYNKVLEKGDLKQRTRDIGGLGSTQDFEKAIIACMS